MLKATILIILNQPESSSSTAESNHNYQSSPSMNQKVPEIDLSIDEIPF